jgi:hypothetical protein
VLTVCGIIAVASLDIAVQTARYAHQESTRGPSPAEVAQARATAVAQRWERLPLGQIFPANVGYTTGQATSETAARLGIGVGDSCDQALDVTLRAAADRLGCVAALRASYADELGGTVYTVGVVVFPDSAAASGFAGVAAPGAYPATGLNALSLAGTAAALFTDQARQTSAIKVTGPYVVLAVSGYADGRTASKATQPRQSIFSGPASQLVTAVVDQLARPQPVSCADPEFAC